MNKKRKSYRTLYLRSLASLKKYKEDYQEWKEEFESLIEYKNSNERKENYWKTQADYYKERFRKLSSILRNFEVNNTE